MTNYILNNEPKKVNTLEDLENYIDVFDFITGNEYAVDWMNECQELFLEDVMDFDFINFESNLVFCDFLQSFSNFYTDEYIEFMMDSIDAQIDCYNDAYDFDSVRYINYDFEDLTFIYHREDGPAVVSYNGEEEERYFLNGIEYTKNEFLNIERQRKLNQILN